MQDLTFTSHTVLKCIKAELLQEGIIFLIHLFARAISLMKELKIEETKATEFSTFRTDIINVGLVFLISNFFTNKISQGRKSVHGLAAAIYLYLHLVFKRVFNQLVICKYSVLYHNYFLHFPTFP